MSPTDNKQLHFDFMNEPKQLSPKTEYRAYLRSVRDPNVKGQDYVFTKTKKRKSVSPRCKV